MAEPEEVAEINYEEQYRILSEENKKLSIDIASLQLSNRSLVNQNRDEKKKVMDCRLQISDLESRLKTLDNIKLELSETQLQAERLRQTLDANENKLQNTERRATEAEGLVKVKDSIIDKQRKFSKELEDEVQNITGVVDHLKSHCAKLEGDLCKALERAEESDKLRDALASKTALLDKIAESSKGVSDSGLAAANQYFKEQEAKMKDELALMKQVKSELEKALKEMTTERDNLQSNIEEQSKSIVELKEKCANLETAVKESKNSDKRSKNDMNSRLIGPALPPWLLEEKKPDPNEIEKLNNTDPATLRTRVIDLEGKVHELKQLVTYREDVILRIYQEIQKKSSKLEASEVERSSLSAQVGILKKELNALRGSGRRSEVGYPPEIEIEIERLRGKRDREYQRRKRAEAEMDEMEAELNEMKEKVKKMEDELAEIANAPKPVIHAGDPVDKARIAELQTVVNQLRLDNESKRSELFDLRSRFEEKSAMLESLSNDIKAKERQVVDLTTELTNKSSQLEQTIKELESVRLRAIRGGVETERWQMDLNSVRTSNRFLSQQTNELRLRLTTTEEQLNEARKNLSVLKNRGGETSALNGHTDPELVKEVAELKSQLGNAKETITNLEGAESELSELKTKYDALIVQLKSVKQNTSVNNSTDSERLSQLLSDLKKEQESSAASAERVSQLTKQLAELETTLSETRQRLNGVMSENRRNDLEHAAGCQDAPISPPTKRARRSTRSSSNPTSQVNSQFCALSPFCKLATFLRLMNGVFVKGKTSDSKPIRVCGLYFLHRIETAGRLFGV
ncbi:unnamed protein product [Hymenolepis diminuta]|uniref:Uncharacterized protein n=1 Tax=Hymenolepis diminuta TaxID=6216 RepID=A0A564Z6T8_HYMDI|nr:unnamed protein product [Hymenolepis diminuta]